MKKNDKAAQKKGRRVGFSQMGNGDQQQRTGQERPENVPGDSNNPHGRMHNNKSMQSSLSPPIAPPGLSQLGNRSQRNDLHSSHPKRGVIFQICHS